MVEEDIEEAMGKEEDIEVVEVKAEGEEVMVEAEVKEEVEGKEEAEGATEEAEEMMLKVLIDFKEDSIEEEARLEKRKLPNQPRKQSNE